MEPNANYQWYYTLLGRRLGPVSEAEVVNLLENSTLDGSTLVWREGLNDWIPVNQTAIKWTRKAPPPLTGSAVGSGLVWVIAVAPILGALLEKVVEESSGRPPHSFWFITLLINLALCVIDSLAIKRAGHNTSSFGGWAWLVPVYLFKRSKALKQSPAYFVTWLVCFVVSLFV
jgi:hypothetical protein